MCPFKPGVRGAEVGTALRFAGYQIPLAHVDSSSTVRDPVSKIKLEEHLRDDA